MESDSLFASLRILINTLRNRHIFLMSQPIKILVVEDNDFVRMQIATFLSEGGYVVVESTDGDDALIKIGSHDNVALAVVDVRMEPVGGFEFIRSMRSFDMEVPVVLVTGDNNPELLTDAQKLGVAAVLMKPVEKDRLLKTIERSMRKIKKD